MSEVRRHPVLISGVGFAICLGSFVIGALLGQGIFTSAMFYVGFGITAIGVLIGFLAYKRNS